MKINKIAGEECKLARSLWEEVFPEDSIQFTDYYFEHKASKNIGYVIEDAPYDAMLFRTPYVVQIGEEKRELSYLVGVATRKEHRHKGYMRQLLAETMKEMYEEKQPFTFLMPANPTIYEPFGFRYVYERDEWNLTEEVIEESGLNYDAATLELQAASMESKKEKQVNNRLLNGIYGVKKLQKKMPEYPVLEQLADFANRILKEKYKIYVYRDVAYYEMLLKELEAQNGDIYLFFENGSIKAYFLYAKEEGKVFIQEVLQEDGVSLECLQKQQYKKPIIMARIVHLEEMMRLVRSEMPREVILKVEDKLIPDNNGVFRWKISREGSQVFRLENDAQAQYCVSIEELAPLILKDVFLNEIV